MVTTRIQPEHFKNGSAISKMSCKRSRLSGRERRKKRELKKGEELGVHVWTDSA